MATRLKTVEYWFPALATAGDGAATPFGQITVYLPEDAKVFRSVFVDIQAGDAYTTATNVTQRQTELRLGAAAYTVVNNTQTLTQGGENFTHQFSSDFTGHFTTNWTGTSMTCDLRVSINTSATGSRNITARLVVTYEYDDASSTHVKTVWIPLDAPTGALPTAKPGTPNGGTVPNLSTYLPEASVTIRQTAIVVQGNHESNNTTDIGISFEAGTSGAQTSQLWEKGTNVDNWYRWGGEVSFATNAEHDFFLWATASDFDHPQAYLVVTYEFDPAATTTMLVSLLLPVEFGGPMGGPTSSDFQRAQRDLWIEEASPALTRAAVFVFYDKLAAQAGVNVRVGAEAFTSYTCVGTTLGGGSGLMRRSDSAFTLARGKNTANVDIYNTDAVDLGFNLSALWMLNYTCAKPTQGVGAANKTIIWNLRNVGTGAAAAQSIISATAPVIPEPNHFRSSVALQYIYTSNGTGNPSGVHIGAERLAGEGGLIWENVYEAIGGTDPETGIRQAFATARSVFRRWPGDIGDGRLDMQQSRRWRICLGGACASFDHLDLLITYHTITFEVAGTLSGGFVDPTTLSLCRADTGERVLEQTVAGDGAFSFTWYDNTEEVFVSATDGTRKGRSDAELAAGSP